MTTTDLTCILVSEEIRRDRQHEEYRGEGLGATQGPPPPAPEMGGSREPARRQFQKKKRRRRRKEEGERKKGEWRRITRRGYKGKEERYKIPSRRPA